VIGWALAGHMGVDLTCDALKMAVATRGGYVRGVIFRSDRGSQYTARDYREMCAAHGIRQSMGATGVCWDNAGAEAFFASLRRLTERELVNRYRWPHRADARHAACSRSRAGTTPTGSNPPSSTAPRSRPKPTGTVTKKPLPHKKLSVKTGATQSV
jgi:transposase InsO family protein